MTYTAYVCHAYNEFKELSTHTTQDAARGSALIYMAKHDDCEEMVIEDDSLEDGGDKVVERWYSDGKRLWPA